MSNLYDFCEAETLLFAACKDSLTHPTAEFDERFIKGRDTGFSVDIAKDYVATLTDRCIPRRLRDPKRNRSFSKVTLDNRDGEELILCGLMISFSNSIAKRQVGVSCSTGLLSKKPGTCCPRSVLYCNLHSWKQRGRAQYTEARAHARRKLHILRDLSQFYLG